MKNDLLSGRIRTAVREELVGWWTLGTIGDLFEAEGLQARASYEPNVSGERRTYVEQFYVAVDWTNWNEVRTMLRVIETVLDRMRDREDDDMYGSATKSRESLETLLRRDGFELDEFNAIRPRWELLTQQAVQKLPDESAIPGHLRRMWDAVEERPEQSLSAAKDAIESAARHALNVLSVEVLPKPKFPALVDLVQRSMKLHPTTVAPDTKGAGALVSMFGSLANIANKIDEVRNLYGDGHGRVTRPANLTSRHSRFIARCAEAYVGMLLDTLDAPGAPWRKERKESGQDDG